MGLKEADFSEGLEYIGNNAFAYCGNLKYVNLSDNLISVGLYAFYDDPIMSVTLPDTVTFIGKCALGNNTIEEFYIPKGITRLEDGSSIFGDYGMWDFSVRKLAFSDLQYLGKLLDRPQVSGNFKAKVYTRKPFESYFPGVDTTFLEENEEFMIYHPNGGQIWLGAFEVVTVGMPYPELDWPEREGYQFDGWYTTRTGGSLIVEGSTVTAEGDHRIYAHWTKLPDEEEPEEENLPEDPADSGGTTDAGSFLVRFYVGEELIYSETVAKGNTVSKVPSAEGEGVFSGWVIKDTGSLWDAGSPVTGNLDLKAKFEPKETRGDLSGSGLDPIPDFSGTEVYLVNGQTGTLSSKETWTSDNPSVIRIRKKKKYSAEKGGVARLTGSGGSSYTVYVASPSLPASETLAIGEEKELDLKGLEEYPDHYPITWLSDSPEVVSVDQGRIHAVGSGQAKVQAYVNGKKHSCTVKVLETLPVESIGSSVTIVPLQTIRLSFDDGFPVKNAKWTSSLSMNMVASEKGEILYYRDDVVKITPEGKLTAIGSGTTVITAENDGKTKTFTVEVRMLGREAVYLNKGSRKKLRYYKVRTDGKDAAKWESSDTSVVRVSKTGKLTGLKAGKAVVTCSYNPWHTKDGFVFSTEVFVEKPSIETDGRMKYKKGRYHLKLESGEKYEIKLKNVYHPVLFKSDSNTKAFADESGTVYARSRGKAKLSCSVNGRKLNIDVTITL